MAEQLHTHNSDAYVQALQSKNHNVDCYIQDLPSRFHNVDVFVLDPSTRHNVDCHVVGLQSLNHNADCYTSQSGTPAFQFIAFQNDSLGHPKGFQVGSTIIFYSVDVYVLVTIVLKSYNADCCVQIDSSKTYNVDCFVLDHIFSHNVDAYLSALGEPQRVHVVDACVLDLHSKTYSADCYVQGLPSPTHSVDCYIPVGLLTYSHSVDCYVTQAGIAAFQDVGFQNDNIGQPKTFQVFLALQSASHTIDAYTVATPSMEVSWTHNVDAYVQGLLSKSHNVDLDVVGGDRTFAHSVDCYVQVDSSKIHSVDCVVRADASKSHNVDINVVAGDRTFSHSTDSDIQATASKSHNVDADVLLDSLFSHSVDARVFETLEVSKSNSVDAYTLGLHSFFHSVDAYIQGLPSPAHRVDCHIPIGLLTIVHNVDVYVTQARIAAFQHNAFQNDDVGQPKAFQVAVAPTDHIHNVDVFVTGGSQTSVSHNVDCCVQVTFPDAYTLISLAQDPFSSPDRNPLDPTKWSLVPPGVLTYPPLQIVSNACEPTALLGGFPQGNENYTGITWPDNQYIEVTILTSTTDVNHIGEVDFILRSDVPQNNCYDFIFVDNADGTATIIIVVFVNDVESSPLFINTALPFNAGDVFRAQAFGSQLSLYQNGVLVGSVVDTTFGSGLAALNLVGTTLNSDIRVSNFNGGLVELGPPAYSVDAYIQGLQPVSHNVDVYVQSVQFGAFQINAFQNPIVNTVKAFQITGGQTTSFVSHNADCFVQWLVSPTHNVDACIKADQSFVHNVDACVQVDSSKTHSVDAIVRADSSKSHFVDAYIQGLLSKSHSVDVYVTVTGATDVTVSHSVDCSVTLLCHTTLVIDTFNRPDEVPIKYPWLQFGFGFGDPPSLRNHGFASGSQLSFSVAIYGGVAWDNNQWVRATLGNLKIGSGYLAIIIRQVDSQNFYYIDLDASPGFGGVGVTTPLNLQKIVNGVLQGPPYAGLAVVVPQIGDVFEIGIFNNVFSVFQNGNLIGSFRDPNKFDFGNVGLSVETVAPNTNTGDIFWSRFEAGNYVCGIGNSFADTCVQTTSSPSHSVDCYIQVDSAKSHNVDVDVAVGDRLSSHNVDADVQIDSSRIHNVDAEVAGPLTDQSHIHNVDCYIQVVIGTPCFQPNAFQNNVLGPIRAFQVTSTAILHDVSHNVDVYIQGLLSKSYNVDTDIQVDSLFSHNVDCDVQVQESFVHNVDCYLTGIADHTFSVDADIFENVDHAHFVDTCIQQDASRSHNVDCCVRQDSSFSHSADCCVQPDESFSHSVDADLTSPGIGTSLHFVDCCVQQDASFSHSVDANILISQVAISHSVDTDVQVDNSLTHSVDALVQVDGFGSHFVDVYLQGFNNATHSADASVLSPNVSVSHSVDCDITLDLDFSHSVDCFPAQLAQVSYSNDAFVVGLQQPTHNVDVVVFENPQVSHNVDVYVKIPPPDVFARVSFNLVVVRGVSFNEVVVKTVLVR